MPVPNLTLHSDSTKDIGQLRQSVEGGVNSIIAQINVQANRFSQPQDAQGNTIKNLPTPKADGDAVPLGYLTQALATLTNSLSNTLNRRTKPYLDTGIKPFQVIFKAAVQQGTNTALGFSFTGTPLGVALTGTGTDPLVFAALNFVGTGTVQDHFPLPDDWAPEGGINLDIYWTPGVSSGTAGTWTAAVTSVPAGSTWDGNLFNTVGSAVVTGTNRILNRDTISSFDLGTMNPGDECFFKFGRSDTGTNGMGLIELRFLIYRNI